MTMKKLDVLDAGWIALAYWTSRCERMAALVSRHEADAVFARAWLQEAIAVAGTTGARGEVVRAEMALQLAKVELRQAQRRRDAAGAELAGLTADVTPKAAPARQAATVDAPAVAEVSAVALTPIDAPTGNVVAAPVVRRRRDTGRRRTSYPVMSAVRSMRPALARDEGGTMFVKKVLHWRYRQPIYKLPEDRRFDPLDFEVAPIVDDATARAFVTEHHYAGSYPAARFRYGIYRRTGALEGVAVYSHPVNDRVLDVLPCDRLEGVELGRLVLLDSVLANAESWMIARTFELLRREGIRGVVSFSDPVPRTNATGERIFPGHLGFIYRATNASYNGRSTAQGLRILPNGTVFSRRAMQKVRAQDRGHEYAERILVQHGARPRRMSEDARAWLRDVLQAVTRPLRHEGNLRYLFGLDRATKKLLPPSLPYPSFEDLV
jgi:hypothetical protein